MGNIVTSVLKEKCPYCHNGDVFEKTNSKFTIPNVKPKCEVCNKKFDGEPGYFFGAMYVSYAIGIALAVGTFILFKFILQIDSVGIIISSILAVLLLLSFKNYKWSRIIWLKIFPHTKS